MSLGDRPHLPKEQIIGFHGGKGQRLLAFDQCLDTQGVDVTSYTDCEGLGIFGVDNAPKDEGHFPGGHLEEDVM